MMGSGGAGGLGGSSGSAGATQQNLQQQMGGAAEAASPISSIPPAPMSHFSMTSTTSTGGGGGGGSSNFDEDMLGGGGDVNELGGGADPSSGGGGGGNRWPRQETLALIKIRSEMDVAFRDATLKGPLWDHVSRKLGELGYKRSAKKCKEKFENVHKYYKRTKEERAGRQDGKSYRFFSELEALHGTNVPTAFSSGPAVSAAATITTTTSLQPVAHDPVSVSVGFGQLMPPVISSAVQVQAPRVLPRVGASFPSDSSTTPAPVFAAPSAPASLPSISPATFGVSLSSEGTSSSSYSSGSEEDNDNPTDLGRELDRRELAAHDAAVHHQHKRKRASSLKGPHQHLHRSSSANRERMMEFFEGLMKQVMQKQEAMQQRFLEAIEKREQDRMIREEAWKRQEMARLAREHELLSQERAVSASRDAAIVSFLQKITGQTIQLPQAATNPAASAAAVPVYRPPSSPPQPPPSSQQFHKPQQPAQNYFPQQQQHQPQRSQQKEQLSHQPQQINTQIAATTEKNQAISAAPISSSLEMIVAVPNQGLPAQEIGSTAAAASVDATSSRWPKAEVLALIKLRSTLEPRYQEAGPKGPLWEEISAGMHRMGYKRSSKRCKEKWENINKYFKKVKESNKQRPEDAKTCPYFHELDALYQKKILGSGSSIATSVNTIMSVDQVQQQQQVKELSTRTDAQFQEQGHVPTAMASLQTKIAAQSETKLDGSSSDLQLTKGGLTASLFGEGTDDAGVAEGAKKPESIVKEQQPQNHQRQLMMNEYGEEKLDEDNLEQEDDEYNYDDELDEDDEAEEETKMAYTIQVQRQNTGSSNGGGTGAPSFLAMVQ